MWRWFCYLSLNLNPVSFPILMLKLYRLYNAIKTFNVTGIAIRVYCSYDRL